MKRYTFHAQAQVRAAFWQGWQDRARPKLADGDFDVRVEFVDFVDMLARDGHITEELAREVTL